MAMQCDLCDHWFCNGCLKFTKQTYERIEKSKTTDGIMWFCTHCRISLPATKKLISRLDKLEELQSKNEKMIQELQKKSGANSKSVQNNPTKPAENLSVANIVSQVLEEQQEREMRKLNVVCFGLPESEQTTPEGRREDDKTRVNRVVQEIMGLDITVQNNPIRLGRYTEDAQRPRPIKFSVDNVATKQKIIDGSRTKVRKSSQDICKYLYFQSDLSLNQRKEAYLKRQERRNRSAIERSQTGGAGGSSQDLFH